MFLKGDQIGCDLLWERKHLGHPTPLVIGSGPLQRCGICCKTLTGIWTQQGLTGLLRMAGSLSQMKPNLGLGM